ncbi:hypothetical protein GWK91_01685 [Virgibacillus sp. MSP4-1]|nr:hypothetical protein [Virgibacillus sp. MSP4-1]QHS21732.1 hypothetical protein GWK91_01685 [Virgibacillus sp. MSP4-1]
MNQQKDCNNTGFFDVERMINEGLGGGIIDSWNKELQLEAAEEGEA